MWEEEDWGGCGGGGVVEDMWGGARLTDCDSVFNLFILFGIGLSELLYRDDTWHLAAGIERQSLRQTSKKTASSFPSLATTRPGAD